MAAADRLLLSFWRKLQTSCEIDQAAFDSFSSKGGKHGRVKELIIFEFAAAVSHSQNLCGEKKRGLIICLDFPRQFPPPVAHTPTND